MLFNDIGSSKKYLKKGINLLHKREASFVHNNFKIRLRNLMHSGKPTLKEANDMGKRELSEFKGRVMKANGYTIDNENPDAVKYEVAKEQGVPLKEGYNGHLTSEQAGKVGGPIGGNMVKEMVRMAQEQLKKK